jgi:type I restriction enzyme S subunit
VRLADTEQSAGHSAPELGELAEGWALCTVRDLVEINYGKGLIASNRAGGTVPVYGSNGVVGSHNVALAKGPAIVLGRKGTVGAVHYSPIACWPIDTTYFVDHFDAVDASYLTHVLRSLDLSELDTSTAVPGLNREDIYRQSVSLPPLREQKRIVERVQELLARVNGARDRLRRVPAILKRFRQAVLAAACSGRLTADWQEGSSARDPHEMLEGVLERRSSLLAEMGAERHKEPFHPDAAQLADVPEGWAVASMDQLTCLITSGSRGWARYYSQEGPFFVRAQNIASDELRMDEVAHVRPPNNAEGRRTQIRSRDLLVTITGANVTKSALVEGEVGEAYVMWP